MRNIKKVFALVLAMAMSLSLAVTAGAAYKDGDKISDEYAVAVEVASQLGVLEGFEDGTYGPQKTLTRAQLATMTYRLATGDVTDVYTEDFAGGAAEKFSDTHADAWYAGYVSYAADAGYLKGVGDGLYKPDSAMTGYQALAAFLRIIGYNQPGQFTGPDWTSQVAQVAYDIGALEGISNVDLNAAISREVAAQIIYNILFSDLVSYTPAFGYQNSMLKDDLATEIFDIADDDSVVAATAPWGQPADEWYNSDGDVVVSIPYAPVAEYTVAVEECALADDLGLGAEEGDVIEWYLNGDDMGTYNNIIDIRHENTIGDQGTVTEIYEIDGEYWVVQIETWLGQITETTDAKYDKGGHLVIDATAYLDVFTGRDCGDLDKSLVTEDGEYEVGDFVLVRYSYMEDGYYLDMTAPVITGVQTYLDVNKEFSTIGGKDHDWAAHYHYGFSGLLNTVYEVFVDYYGNVIGIQEPDPADPVYTIFEKAIEVTSGFDPYIAGKLVDLTTGDLNDIEVCSYDLINDWIDNEITYIHSIVSYVECEDGYEMIYAADHAADDYNIIQGVPRIVVGTETFVSDAYTVYAVEMECGEYEMYTGYTNVPTVIGTNNSHIEILDSDDDGYIDLVYVDATNAMFADEVTFAYVLDNVKIVGDGELSNGSHYTAYANVLVKGEVVEVKSNVILSAYADTAVYLQTDNNGLVSGVEVIVGFPGLDVYFADPSVW